MELALSLSAVRWTTRRRIQRKRLILAYHGVVPDGEAEAGERSLFVSQREFARQLDMLMRESDVVPLDQIDELRDDRPRVAITFDDAYAGAVNEGVEELVKRGLPATIFAVAGRLDGSVFWWDALSNTGGALDEAMRDHALHTLAGAEEGVRAWAAGLSLPVCDALPKYAHAATRAELAAALSCPGITVGSHTWSHRNLAALGESELAEELRHSRAWLRAEFGDKAIDWLAYPYGLASTMVQRAADEAGYTGALCIGGGWHRPADVSPFDRPRFSIGSRLSVAGLRARLHGARLA